MRRSFGASLVHSMAELSWWSFLRISPFPLSPRIHWPKIDAPGAAPRPTLVALPRAFPPFWLSPRIHCLRLTRFFTFCTCNSVQCAVCTIYNVRNFFPWLLTPKHPVLLPAQHSPLFPAHSPFFDSRQSKLSRELTRFCFCILTVCCADDLQRSELLPLAADPQAPGAAPRPPLAALPGPHKAQEEAVSYTHLTLPTN